MTQVIKLNRIQSMYIEKSIAINQIEIKRDISDIPTNNCALRARYGVSNRIESNRNIYISINRINKISYQ